MYCTGTPELKKFQIWWLKFGHRRKTLRKQEARRYKIFHVNRWMRESLESFLSHVSQSRWGQMAKYLILGLLQRKIWTVLSDNNWLSNTRVLKLENDHKKEGDLWSCPHSSRSWDRRGVVNLQQKVSYFPQKTQVALEKYWATGLIFVLYNFLYIWQVLTTSSSTSSTSWSNCSFSP